MIIYYSGTGSSLYIAKKLAEKTGDVAVPLIELKENPGQYDLAKEEKIGIVAPVFFGDIPATVREYLATVSPAPGAYIYGIAVCGGAAGVALYSLQEIIRAGGGELSYGKAFFLISSSTAAWKSEVSYDYTRLDGTDALIDEVAAAVAARRRDSSAVERTLLGRLLSSDLLKKWGMPKFRTAIDAAKCVGCGICERLCPNHNIHLSRGRAEIGSDCSHCLGCAHSCPQGAAMVNGHAIRQQNQYHYPGVTLEERFLR